MQPPFPTLDELSSTGVPARAEPARGTGVPARAEPTRSTGVPARAEPMRGTGEDARANLVALGDVVSKQPSPLSPLSHRVGEGERSNEAAFSLLPYDKGRPPFPEYAPPASSDAAPDLDAIRAEAEAIRLRAIQDAERIREQALREGYQRGYEQGYADGAHDARQHAEAELQQTVANLRSEVEQLIQSVQAQYEAYLQHAEAHMLELALEVARKIVREELKLQPEHALAIVRDALRRVQGFVHIRIRVNPLDLELVRQNRATLLQVIDGIEGVEIVEDRRVDQGGCIVETEQGVYDARIRTQLSEIERVIREAA
ncbi:MAG: FliH/SctL family protein [Fimbriimonadales bacterium]|nr:FliH/SctL family protein [Fimbriimonadales bacterium]